jgi:hypothetical protein
VDKEERSKTRLKERWQLILLLNAFNFFYNDIFNFY